MQVIYSYVQICGQVKLNFELGKPIVYSCELAELWIGQTLHAFLFRVVILLHSERPKLYTILTFLSAIGLREDIFILF